MRKWFRRNKSFDKENENFNDTPYEEREIIHPLSMVVTIINRDQFRYYTEKYHELGASFSMILYSYSMPPEEYRNILGIDSTKKEILLTFCRAEDVKKLLEVAEERFMISPAAKGIAFAVPVDSVSGIAAYKFIADQNDIVNRNVEVEETLETEEDE